MNDSVRTSPSAVRPVTGVLWAGLGFLIAAALLGVSSVLHGSMSGELNPNSPSNTEIATWEWGQNLFSAGVALLVVWSVLVVLLRRRLTLTGASAAAIVIGGFIFCVVVTFATWMIVLPPLPNA